MASCHRSYNGADGWNPQHGVVGAQSQVPTGCSAEGAIQISWSVFRWQQWNPHISRAGLTLWVAWVGHAKARLQIGRPSGSRHALRQEIMLPCVWQMIGGASWLGWALNCRDSSCEGFRWGRGLLSVL